MTALERLEQLARKQGWRLTWRDEADPWVHSLRITTLDISRGGQPAIDRPEVVTHTRDFDGRACIAARIVAAAEQQMRRAA